MTMTQEDLAWFVADHPRGICPDFVHAAEGCVLCANPTSPKLAKSVVVLSPDRLARHDAHQWLLIEAFEKLHISVIVLHNPLGDSPQGQRLMQMPGLIAAYERAQITDRTRRGRVEIPRRGACMPWAYRGDGYRYWRKRHGYAPQVVIEPVEAAVVRDVYRMLVE